MDLILRIVDLLLSVAWFFAIAHVIMSWLINFGVLNLHQPIVGQIWDGLNRLLEPAYRPIRNILPQTGGLDLAPLVFFIGIIIARMIVTEARISLAGY
ncbi:YGGT family protein [Jannaschia seosinensis]|uniref:YGGT family protein n=1 Tax=Jannaschia seosinensis TaxID=313367 RepID=A0A0M7BBR6_9RHOB|nr:YggT family protein [Jannaschia seosinensis]CUH38780.1 YGGT family protein [Jannaschia seosinensis]